MEQFDRRAVWPGWETVRLIGRGSFGAVYEIRRDMFGTQEKAALKVITIPQGEGDVDDLRSDGFDDESITDTFKAQLRAIVDEYSLMRKLNGSANVVNCDDVLYQPHEDGIGWTILIKMELLTPLSKALPERIPQEMVEKIGSDISKALVLCKRFNIVHRDIKPQNIFFSDLGDYKLGDFGVAKTVEKTRGGTKIGTYKYMAPEVYNNQPYGQGADVYSLGLVLYWLLNERRMPFVPLPPVKLRAGMEEEARERRLGGEAIPAPLNGSEALKRIVLKAVAYDPRNRYQTAEELLRDLERLQIEEVVKSGASAAMKNEAQERTGYAREETSFPSASDMTRGGSVSRPSAPAFGQEPFRKEPMENRAPAFGQAPFPAVEDATVRGGLGNPVAPVFGWASDRDDEATVRGAFRPGAVPGGSGAPLPGAGEDGTIGVLYRQPARPPQESKPQPQGAPTPPPTPERTAAPPAREIPKTGKKNILIFVILGMLLLAGLGVGAFFLFGGSGNQKEGQPQTVALSSAEKKEIGDNASVASSMRGVRGVSSAMPFLYGITKENCIDRLKNLTNDSGMYVMRYNLKGNQVEGGDFRVLRSDPVAGTELESDTAIHVELTSSETPQGAVYFHMFTNPDGSIRKGVFLDKTGAAVRTILYSYAKLRNGNTLMREEVYNAKGELIDLWTHEFKGDGYLRSSGDEKNCWMKQIHYSPDGIVLGEYFWDGSWKS